MFTLHLIFYLNINNYTINESDDAPEIHELWHIQNGAQQLVYANNSSEIEKMALECNFEEFEVQYKLIIVIWYKIDWTKVKLKTSTQLSRVK